MIIFFFKRSYIFIVIGLVHILLTSSGNKVVGAKTTLNLVLFGVLCLVILGLGIFTIVSTAGIIPEFDTISKAIDFEETMKEGSSNPIFAEMYDAAEKLLIKYLNELYGIVINGFILGACAILYSLLLMYVKCASSVKLA